MVGRGSSGHRSLAEQFTLEHCNLSIEHAAEIQLVAVCKGNLLRRVRKCSRMTCTFNLSHQHQHASRSLFAGTKNYFCECANLFFFLGLESFHFVTSLSTCLCSPHES